jgi:beta-glucosidase
MKKAGKTDETEQKIDALLAAMTLEEKVDLCHAGSKFAVNANPRLGIPEFWMSDGPHGVRREIRRDCWDAVETETDYATYLPTGTALAATWNRELARRHGEVLGAEARERGKDIILGPASISSVIRCAGGISNITAKIPITLR